MRKRCIWSNHLDEAVRDLEIDMLNRWGTRVERRVLPVCPAHEAEVRRFAALLTGAGRLFMPLILILILVMFAGGFADSLALDAGSVIALGVIVLVFPFATPETVQMMGLRASITLARILGVVTIAIGAAILLL